MAHNIFKTSTIIVPILFLLFILKDKSNYVDGAENSFDIKIKYFTNTNLICDHPDLNITQRDDVKSLHWIFPGGDLITSKTWLDPNHYRIAGVSANVSPSSPVKNYDGYNLTVLNVNDDVFGYYSCIVLLDSNVNTNPQSQQQQLLLIRYGLNVDGADFSELVEEYKKNAMVGGIAAGCVLALIAIGWFVWYYRCYDKDSASKVEMVDGVDEMAVVVETKYGIQDSKVGGGTTNKAFDEERHTVNENGNNADDTNSRL